jgi:hypothetical protein
VDLSPTGLTLTSPNPVAAPAGAIIGTTLYAAAIRTEVNGDQVIQKNFMIRAITLQPPATPVPRSDADLLELPFRGYGAKVFAGPNVLAVALSQPLPPFGNDSGAVQFVSVDPTDSGSFQLRGVVRGLASVTGVAFQGATRAYLSTSAGLLRVDLSDLDNPRIDGGQENVGVSEIRSNLLFDATPRTISVYTLAP